MEIKKYKKILLEISSYFISISFAIIAGIPLLHPGLIPTHDGEYHIIRFYEFYKMLQGGTVYPRWAPDLNFGYGVPLFTYVYPLPNYIASLFHIFSVSFIDTFKLNMFVATIIGSIGMYLWSKHYWGRLGGIISAVFYTYSPYHFVDVYIRGSVGEVWGLGLFPFFLWSLDRLQHKQDVRSVVVAGILCACLIFSHNILGLVYITVAIAYSCMLVFSKRINYLSMIRYLSVIILGMGLSAIFWIPALYEKQYVVGLQVYDVTKNFADFSQLLIPSWGSDFFGSTSSTPMSVQVGIANLLSIFIGIAILVRLLRKSDRRYIVLFFFIGLFFISCFFMLSASQFFWTHIPFLSYFQFPWRLLSIVIFCCSFFAGSVSLLPKRFILAFIFILIAFLSTIQYSFPAHYFMRSDAYYLTRSNFIDSTNSIGNEFNSKWANGIIKRADTFIDTVYPNDTINYKQLGETFYKIKTRLSHDRTITINILYFPGWTMLANGKSVHLFPDKLGRIQFLLPKGMYTINFFLQETLLQSLAKWISLVFAGILFTLLIKNWYSNQYAYRR